MPHPARLLRRAIVAAPAVALSLLSLPAPAAAGDLWSIVDRLRAASRIDRALVEQPIGRRLVERPGNRFFAIFDAAAIPAAPVVLSRIELREPKPGAGATAGPIVVLTIGRGCVGRRDTEARYGPLTVTGVPRGRSREEMLMLSRDEPGGRLSFGFAEMAPDCLASVVFAARAARP